MNSNWEILALNPLRPNISAHVLYAVSYGADMENLVTVKIELL